MKKIEIKLGSQEEAKAVELIENYNNGINKHVGTTAGAIRAVTWALDYGNPDFAQYLIDNEEARAYIGLFNGVDYFSVKDAARLFKLYPTGYEDVVRRAQQVQEDSEYREMIDSNFEEYAPQLENVPYRYLPKRHKNNTELIMKLLAKDAGYVIYVNDCDLPQAVKVNHKCLEHKTSNVKGAINLMRKLCAANPECAAYACSPITTNAGVKREDTKEEKKRKVNAWLTGTGERKALNNASGGGVARVKTPTNQTPKAKFKI